jgi:hypothetical protein
MTKRNLLKFHCFGHWNISVLVIVSDFEIRISNFLPKNRGFRSDTMWERPLAATSAGAWVGMTEKKAGRIRGPSVPVTPVPDQVRDDGPGVHFNRLKVTGDILPLPDGLPPSRSDEHGFPGSSPGQALLSQE